MNIEEILKTIKKYLIRPFTPKNNLAYFGY